MQNDAKSKRLIQQDIKSETKNQTKFSHNKIDKLNSFVTQK